MGLLDKIEGGNFVSRSSLKEEGLSNAGELSFFEFITKHSLKRVAVLSKIGANFVMSESSGFDCTSIFSSFSTADFWDGSISPTGWSFFKQSANNLLPFLQFFSQDLKDSITFIATYYFSDKILFICMENEELDFSHANEISKDFHLVNFDSLDYSPKPDANNVTCVNSYSFVCNVEEAISDALNKNLTPTMANCRENLANALKSDIISSLYNLTSSIANYFSAEEYKITVNFKSNGNISANCFDSFIKLSLKKILGESASKIKNGI